jgi:hypothetical protein
MIDPSQYLAQCPICGAQYEFIAIVLEDSSAIPWPRPKCRCLDAPVFVQVVGSYDVREL